MCLDYVIQKSIQTYLSKNKQQKFQNMYSYFSLVKKHYTILKILWFCFFIENFHFLHLGTFDILTACYSL